MFIPTLPLCEMLANFSGVESKRLYHSSRKEKESRCLVFTSSTKHEIRQFHIEVVQQQQRHVSTKKHDACAKVVVCQFKPIAFSLFSLQSPSSLLKLPISCLEV